MTSLTEISGFTKPPDINQLQNNSSSMQDLHGKIQGTQITLKFSRPHAQSHAFKINPNIG